ncbi:MAG: hypothetical protein JNJ49_07005 [Bdellovibrionaceae bacterium]|nr:hypothetical protein [Pseudobdellovibrionaceae bacterium]
MYSIYLPVSLWFFLILYWHLPARSRTAVAILSGLAILSYFDLRSTVVLFFLVAITTASISMLLSRRRLAMFIGIAAGATPLFVFKLIPQLWTITDTQSSMPIGVSYFSIIMLGLLLDFARQKQSLEIHPKHVFSFGLISALFPFGPIERWQTLGPQLKANRAWSTTRATEGLYLLSLGIFKKLVVADRIGKPYEEFRQISLQLSGSEILAFMCLAFVQMFCDFSSLSDITRGIMKLLGIDIIDNFNQPYLAENVPDIWRRWHISLVGWLRDFIYNPIALRTKNLHLATFVVMILVGIWHAPTWNYLAWSTYWTTLYSVAILMRKRGVRLRIPKVTKVLGTFILMSLSALTFVPAQMADIATLWQNAQRAGFHRSFSTAIQISSIDILITVLAFILIVIAETIDRKLATSKNESTMPKTAAHLELASALAILTVAYAIHNSKAFIYMRY